MSQLINALKTNNMKMAGKANTVFLNKAHHKLSLRRQMARYELLVNSSTEHEQATGKNKKDPECVYHKFTTPDSLTSPNRPREKLKLPSMYAGMNNMRTLEIA